MVDLDLQLPWACHVFAFGPFVPTMHIQISTLNRTLFESREEIKSHTPVNFVATIRGNHGGMGSASVPQQLRPYFLTGFELFNKWDPDFAPLALRSWNASTLAAPRKTRRGFATCHTFFERCCLPFTMAAKRLFRQSPC